MNDLVSIIISVYNVEQYLNKCLDSITNQTYRNIEIIIIDDGSNDSSLEIAKEYEKRDGRIRIFTQNNLGSGPARNLGLEKSTGEFCMFVDSDDWVDDKLVETLLSYQKLNDYDLVATKYRVWDRFNKAIKNKKFTNSVIEATNIKDTRNLYFELYGLDYLAAPFSKLYKMSIIKENKLLFPDLRRSQDIVFNYRYYDCIKSVYAKDIAYYNYHFDNKNNFNKVNKDYFKIIELIYEEMMTLYQNGVDGKELDFISNDGYILTCNHLLKVILLALYANTSKNESIKEIIDSMTIQEIVKNCKPIDLFQKLIKYNFANKNILALTMLLKIRVSLKYIYLNIEEIFNKLA